MVDQLSLHSRISGSWAMMHNINIYKVQVTPQGLLLYGNGIYKLSVILSTEKYFIPISN